ncbi:MAG: VanZ family protein [Leucobacter sp.]
MHDERTTTRRVRHPILPVLFGLYLVLLVWTVLWKLDLPYAGQHGMLPVKLVPFFAWGDSGPSLLVEVVANAMLFVPFGVYLRLLAPTWPWWRAAVVFALTSYGLETAQLILAVGSFDTTDLIVNTAGGLAGFAAVSLAVHVFGSPARAWLRRFCTAATCVAVVLTAAFVVSPLQLVRHDTGPLTAERAVAQ